jgi:hypothetical protein
MINWSFFPRSMPLTGFGFSIVNVFKEIADSIDSTKNQVQHSNAVLKQLRAGLETLGFKVESGKTNQEKIEIPVLFERNGKKKKSFNADAHSSQEGWVLEVEAGRAVANNQYLKDVFQACMMQDVQYLAIAVRNTYKNSGDFATVENNLETLYVSGRLQLPLKGILLIGY